MLKLNTVRERINNNFLEVKHVKSEKNLADIFTKPSNANKLKYFADHVFHKCSSVGQVCEWGGVLEISSRHILALPSLQPLSLSLSRLSIFYHPSLKFSIIYKSIFYYPVSASLILFPHKFTLDFFELSTMVFL